jgi:hypothetical protein
MKLSISIAVLFVVSGLAASDVNAEVVTETTIGSGYQGNLFNDSNSTGDTYASAGIVLKYYPSTSTRFAAGAQYNAFASYRDLSNLIGDLSVTIIPTPEGSPLSLALAGAITVRRFGTLYELYDQAGTTVNADISYRLMRWAYLQSSVSYLNTYYTNSDFGSNRSIDITTGVNLTVLGSNSLALRAEYSRRSFDQPTLTQEGAGYALENGQDNSETFEIAGILLRYSRPLGERTGMNLSVGHRQLQVGNDYAVLGYSVDYLSPWADLWEGQYLSGSVKHFFPNQFTTELSFAYFDKSFVDVIEVVESSGETFWRDDRNDDLTTLSLSISRPVLIQEDRLFTPTIHLGYRQNQSSTEYFDYEDVWASISLRVSL